jgi:hypothetical protein
MNVHASIAAAGFFFCASTAFAEAPQIVSASVRAQESKDELLQMTCELVAVADVGGHARLFDVTVGDTRCSTRAPQSDAIPLRVRIEPRGSDGAHKVVFESDVPDEASPGEMRAAVDAVAAELTQRVTVVHYVAPAADTTDAQKSESSGGLRTGGIALVALGGAGVGVGAVMGLVVLVANAAQGFDCIATSILGAQCASHDFSGYGIAAGISAGAGAAFMIAGAIVLSCAPKKSSVAMQLGPTGGSFRVTF